MREEYDDWMEIKDAFEGHLMLRFNWRTNQKNYGNKVTISNLVEKHYFQPSDKLVSLGFDCYKDFINKTGQKQSNVLCI